jgi:MFS family permease
MMTSLCKEYWQFMLAQGLLLGIGMGGLMFPAMGAIPQYFDKKRAAALGLAIAGSSVGGVIFPIALSNMLNSSSLGFEWSVRILGFIMIPPLAFACVVVKSRLPPKSSAFIELSAFRLPTFNWLTAAGFFMFLGIFTPLFYLPAYAVSKGMDSELASYLLAIVNGASTFGRIIPGIMADKLGSINVLFSASIVSGILICCMTQVESHASFYVYSILVGFFSGTIVSGIAASLTRTVKDPRETGTYMGMSMAVISTAVLISPPINGKLLSDYGFFEVALFSGIACLIGGFLGVVAKYTTPEGVLSRT